MPIDDSAPKSALESARQCAARGWAPIPIPFRAKAPVALKWQELRITTATVGQYFNGDPQNVGVLLGVPSGNLVDVDLDTPESRAVAPFFLPTTHAVFGRKTSRTAHYLYVADRAPGSRAFNDPTVAKDDDSKARIVELRGTGGQTVFPGSTHKDTGELIEWEQAGDPARVTYAALLIAVQRVATFALIGTHWDKGTRDDLCTSIVGILIRADWPDHEIEKALHAIAAASDDEKIDTRIEKIERLRRELENGGRVFGFPKLAELTGERVANAVRKWLGIEKEAPEVLAGPQASLATADELVLVQVFEPRVVVRHYMPEDAGAIVGPGGEGKSTLALRDAVMIALGEPVWGREVVRPGPTLVITAEDQRAIVLWRLHKLCTALSLSPEQYKAVFARVHVEDITATFARIAAADKEGTVRPTELVAEIRDKYAAVGLSQVLMDPTSLIGAGERFGNDGFADLLRICRALSTQLKCAVRLVHHVSQMVFREAIKDQYAARGGTAFVDGSRFQHQLLTCDDGKEYDAGKYFGGKWALPATVTDEDVSHGRILVLLVHKLSYELRDRLPIFIRRDGWTFEHITGAVNIQTGVQSEEQVADEDRALAESLGKFLVQQWPERHTRNSLRGYLKAHGIPKNKIDRAVNAAVRLGMLVEMRFPDGEKVGAQKSYLCPAEKAEI